MGETKDYRERVPEEFYQPLENEGDAGTIEEVTYSSFVYAQGAAVTEGSLTEDSLREGSLKEGSLAEGFLPEGSLPAVTKRALVYLPKGYETSGESYRVLYLMHGGGGNEEEYFYGQDGKHRLVYLLDHMIDSGLLEPMIIVTPSFYYSDSQSALHDIHEAGILTANYHQELRRDLIPCVESKYRIKANRHDRAFGGFSMGAETTWEVFLHALDLVENYIPQSGDCWILREKGSIDAAEETVLAMTQRLKDQQFDSLSYNVFAITGDQDIAYPALDAQMKEMFTRGWNVEDKRLRYVSWPEGTHCYDYIYEYLYNVLPDLWK